MEALLRIAPQLVLGVTLSVSIPAMSSPSAPLVIKAQGSFFVGGEKKMADVPEAARTPAMAGDITINQMYVQYQVPINGDRHAPVVMIHGCCLSSKTWETTPDGRMGWSEYFVRKGRSVYLADQVSRARSGFDPRAFFDVRTGKVPNKQMPGIVVATHQLAWTLFRFGPKFGEVYPDQQFPIHAVDEFYKQMIPDLNETLPGPQNPTSTALAALGEMLKGGAVFMAHSESGFFPERAALIDPKGIRGIVSIETQCETNLTTAALAHLAKIPTLVVFGDHLSELTFTFGSEKWSWSDSFAACRTFVDQLKRAGGDAEMMHLPRLGIKGNTHMLMQDINNTELADLLIAWIDRHIESKRHAVNRRAIQ